jgi:hypothetical protein
MKRRTILGFLIFLIAIFGYERIRVAQTVLSSTLTAITDLKVEFQLRDINLHGGTLDFIQFPDLGIALDTTYISMRNIFSSNRQFTIRGESSNPLLTAPGESKEAFLGLHDVKFDFDIATSEKKTTVAVKNLTAKLLGGKTEIKPSTVVLDSPACSAIPLLVNHIGIPQILSLYQNENIEASGHVKGTIPLSVCGKKFRIEKSILTSEQGGNIKIKPPTKSGNPGIDFAFLALQDFDYSSLTAKLSMNEDGAMSIALKLSGTSNSLNNKTPIVVNLNLEENLWALLHSLQITQKIADNYSN